MFKLNDYTWPAKVDVTPMVHQKETALFAIKNKRGFILNEMGTGKTLSILWAYDLLMQAGKIDKVIIVCPLATMLFVWATTIFYNFPHRKYIIAHGSKDYRIKCLKSKANFVIINHDGIKVIPDEIIQSKATVILIDELTAFKSPPSQSERTKTMMYIANRFEGVHGMTGEPTPNSPLECWPQTKIVNPSSPHLPRYYGAFRDQIMIKVNDYLYVPKPEAPNLVASIMQPAIRYKRKDCVDLPETSYQTLAPNLTKEQQDAYDKMKKDMYLMYDRGEVTAVNSGVLLNKLLQISAGAVKTVDGEIIDLRPGPRLEELFSIYEQQHTKKLVIFARNIATIDRLIQEGRNAGLKVGAVYGKASAGERQASLDGFQNGDTNWIILQPQSTAHGITLTAACTTVWFSLVGSNELYQQGNARTIRIGQKWPTLIVRFASTPAEQRLIDLLESREDLSNATLNLFKNRLL